MEAFSAQTGQRATRGGGLCRAGEILKRQHAHLVVSRHKLRQVEGITLVREKRESGNQILGFATRPFVLCGLPIRRPPLTTLLYEPRNGFFTSPDHRSSRFRTTLRTRPARAYISFDLGRAAAEPDHPLQIRRANAGHLRHRQRWLGVPPAGRGLRAHLRRHHLLRHRLRSGSGSGRPPRSLQLPSRGPDLVRARCCAERRFGAFRERNRPQR